MEQLNHVAAQVRDIIVSRIESHEYLPGEMIPSPGRNVWCKPTYYPHSHR